MSTSINIPTIDSPYAAVIGRYGTFQITAIRAQEEDGRPVPFVRLEGIGKRRRAIKGGIGISAETVKGPPAEAGGLPGGRQAAP